MNPVTRRAVVAGEISEADLLQNVRTLAGHLGWVTYHTHRSDRSDKGYPDLTLVSPACRRVVWIELKSERGRLTKEQEWWRNALTTAGQEWYCFKPSDWKAGRIDEALR